MVDISFPINGSVMEFIDWALFVVLVLIIYYVLKLIFIRSDDSGGGERTGGFWDWVKSLWDKTRTGGGGGSGGGSSGGGGGRVVDFGTKLDELDQLLRDYSAEFVRFKGYGNAVLQAHHDFLASLGGYGSPLPPVSAALWQRVVDSARLLASLRTRIDTLCDSIRRDPGFLSINASQQTRFNTLVVNISNVYVDFNNYRIDFFDRYNRGDGPA